MLAILGIVFLIIAVRAHPPLALMLVLIGALVWWAGLGLAVLLLAGGFGALVLLVARHQAHADWPRS